jgi:hypothetical protein
MAEEVNINIVTDTTDATKNVQNLSDEIKSAIVPSIGLAEAIKFGVDSVIEFGKESVKAYKEALKSANELRFAVEEIGGEGEAAFKKLIDQADALEGTSLFDAEAIQDAQGQLIQSLELTSTQVEQLTPKIIELASAQGTDLATATNQIINGLNGQEKALKKAGVDFEATGDKVKDLSNLMQGLEKFTGSAALSLEVSGKGARDAEVAYGKLEEQVGQELVEAFHDFSDALFDTENFLNGNIETTKVLNELYQKQRDFISDVSNKILQQGDAQRDLVIANFQRIKQTRALTREENILYTELLKNQTAQNNQRFNEIKKLQDAREAKVKKDKVATEKELSDYEKLIAKQKELSTAVTEAITDEDIDTANRLSVEYKRVSEQIELIDQQAEFAKNGLKELNAISIELQEQQLEETSLIEREFVAGVGWVTPEKAAEYRQNEKDIRQAEIDATLLLAETGFNILNDYLNANTEARLANLDEEKRILDERFSYEEEKLKNKALGEQLTESQTQTLRAELNKKRLEEQELLAKKESEIKKKQFNREKAFNLIQAGLNGAVAITKAVASAPPPFNIPQIITQSALVAAQIAIIAAQKAPAFAEGGLVKGKGTGTSDSINARVSNGESIINANSTSMFAPLLSAINEIGGGKAFRAEGSVSQGIPQQSTMNTVVKAYVVDSEITTAQKKSGKINSLSTL